MNATRRIAPLLLLALVALVPPAGAAKYESRNYIWTGTHDFQGAVTLTGGAAGPVTTDAIAGASATTMTIANTIATGVSIGNSAACDSILIGTNADADTITIGEATDTTVSITDDQWGVTAAGVATFPSVDAHSAGAFTIAPTTATSVVIGNSAACDTVSVATNADADAVNIGDVSDTVAVTSALWSVTGPGVGSFSSVVTNTITGASAATLTVGDTISTGVSIGNSAAADVVNIGTNTDADVVSIGDWANDTVLIGGSVDRPKSGTTLTAADVNLSKATLQAARFFLVDTASNTVDVDFADDAALDAADVGSTWMFVKTGAGTNAMTVTAGASGVTTVTNHTIGAAATAEDIGDFIRCTAYTTTAILCEISAAD